MEAKSKDMYLQVWQGSRKQYTLLCVCKWTDLSLCVKHCMLTPEIADILLLKQYKLEGLSLSLAVMFGRINSNSKRIKDRKPDWWLSKRKWTVEQSPQAFKEFKFEERRINEALTMKWSLPRTAIPSCSLTWRLSRSLLNSVESRPQGTA